MIFPRTISSLSFGPKDMRLLAYSVTHSAKKRNRQTLSLASTIITKPSSIFHFDQFLTFLTATCPANVHISNHTSLATITNYTYITLH